MATPLSPAQDWASYVAGLPSAGPAAAGWEELKSVSHATHAPDALRIIEDGRILPGVIQESLFTATGTRAIFFSPKFWGGGTRYGVVSFEVDWSRLHASGANLYWVPVDTSYQTSQFRFLVTERDVSSLPVHPYDPKVDNGPVRLVGGRWFWAKAHAAEFLVPKAIGLLDVARVNFAEHRSPYCPRQPNDCPEYGTQGLGLGSRRFAAGLLGAGPGRFDHLLKDGSIISVPIGQALNPVLMALGGFSASIFTGNVFNQDQAEAIIKAASLFLSQVTAPPTPPEVRILTGLISSHDIFLRAFDAVVQKTFKVPGYTCR